MTPHLSSSQRAVWIRWRASLPMPSLHLLRSRSFATWACRAVTQRVRRTHAHAQTSKPIQPGGWLLHISCTVTKGEEKRRSTVAGHEPTPFNLLSLVSRHSESSLLTEAPPTPSMYKYRPAYSSPGKNHTAVTNPNKVHVYLWLSHTAVETKLPFGAYCKVFSL